MVEIIRRDKSGWTFCRNPYDPTARGWVPDYLVA
jgi:hypothetical protein